MGRTDLLPTPFSQAALGSLILFAALPPLSIWPLGWVAPLPWLLLIRHEGLPGRRPYVQLWFAGVLFWLLAAHWLRLPHPATSAGWIAVACYLGLYLPAFIGLARTAVHSLKVPLWVAAPVVWTGLELVRAHLLTGFLMASLAHTQIRWPAILQIADLGGEYAVDFLLMLTAACLAPLVAAAFSRRTVAAGDRYFVGLLPAAVALAATIGYGYWRLNQDLTRSGPRVALIQGDIRADWKADPDRAERIMREYTDLSVAAVRAAQTGGGQPIDLVVWPETMFRRPIVTFARGYKPPAESNTDLEDWQQAGPSRIRSLVSLLGSPVLLGVEAVEVLANPPPGQREYRVWNAAVLADHDGVIVGRYDKIHLVIFGEYIPLAAYIPWLYTLTPLTGGVTAGEQPVALPSGGVHYAPNICYESVLPHVIRRQVVELTKAGTAPDVLVNLTNDAWYWGSSELDMHLACDVMRAIETRKPHLIAANGGISAHIDSCGRIIEESPRQKPNFILADVRLDSRTSLYAKIGDWPAGICAALCVLVACVGVIQSRRK